MLNFSKSVYFWSYALKDFAQNTKLKIISFQHFKNWNIIQTVVYQALPSIFAIFVITRNFANSPFILYNYTALEVGVTVYAH